jgi:N utilization substance protein A
VVQELRGEKIDIIPWHVDAAKFVCNALAPAEISRVIIDEENRSMEVIVPDDFLSVAIGKRGQNVRLASKLTGWHLDVNSETQYDQAMQNGYDSLVQVDGVGVSMADALFEKGFYSAEELAAADIDDLVQIRGIGEEKAKQLITKAQDALDKAEEAAAQEAETQEVPEETTPAADDVETEAETQPPENDAEPPAAPADPVQGDTHETEEPPQQ